VIHENDPKILELLNCSPRNFRKLSLKNPKDNLFLDQIFKIPQTDFIFLKFTKIKSRSDFYIIKKTNSDEIDQFGNLNSVKGLKASYYDLFPIKSLANDLSNNKAPIIGLRYYSFYRYDDDNKVVDIDQKDFISKKYKDARYTFSEYLFNLDQLRYIKDDNNQGFSKINGSINNTDFLITQNNENQGTLLGVINYNGFYVVPPIMTKIDYESDDSFYKVKTLTGNDFYGLDYKGNCIKGNCEEYNKQIKTYYANRN